MNSGDGLRLAVGIATRGRPAILAETLREMKRQTRLPVRILVSFADESDVDAACRAQEAEFLKGPGGLAHQRNTLLDAVGDCDLMLFFDDDFLPAPDYIKATLVAFAANADLVMTTGHVLADGVHGPGLDVAEGRRLLTADRLDAAGGWSGSRGDRMEPTFNGYGCNMAVRLAPARAHGVRFDERLPLYAWYEDIDFSRRLGQHGRVMRLDAARGVHLGVKAGRTSGRRLGYSQVANPLYLWRKGSYPWNHALRSIGRNLLANGARSLQPEPWVDRRGRLAGNGLALLDVLRGRSRPERILEL